MGEYTLTAQPPLGGVDIGIGDNRIRERGDLAIVSVAASNEEALAAALKDGWGLDLPGARGATTAGDVRAIRTGPDQIFLIFEAFAGADAERIVRERVAAEGYTTDQTDGWVALEISGPDTIAALERICPIDLNPQVFPDGAAARTVMEHMGVLILRLRAERVLLLSARSSGRSFLHAVETSYRNVADRG